MRAGMGTFASSNSTAAGEFSNIESIEFTLEISHPMQLMTRALVHPKNIELMSVTLVVLKRSVVMKASTDALPLNMARMLVALDVSRPSKS